MLIVLAVYGAVLLKARPTPFGIASSAIAMAASIIAVNIGLSAYSFKVFAARTDA